MTSSTAALADKAAKDYPTIKAKAANLVTATGRMQNSGTIQTQTNINASLTSLASLEASHPDLAKDLTTSRCASSSTPPPPPTPR